MHTTVLVLLLEPALLLESERLIYTAVRHLDLFQLATDEQFGAAERAHGTEPVHIHIEAGERSNTPSGHLGEHEFVHVFGYEEAAPCIPVVAAVGGVDVAAAAGGDHTVLAVESFGAVDVPPGVPVLEHKSHWEVGRLHWNDA